MTTVKGQIKPYNSITNVEIRAAISAMDSGPLSGYLAGKERGGPMVCALEDAWCEAFNVRHAVACNSNTSGMLAAAFAVGLKAGDQFVCPAMTMSATAAAPMFTGATPFFVDVEDETFSLPSNDLPYDKSVFVTNLFGHPADLSRLREWCDLNKTFLIEDNAQAPFATERDKYAGTVGHIGIFSLNVHKPMQCGEGGVCVTDDDDLAFRLRSFINHSEHVNDRIGLNLRMPEVCAAIALAQLRRADALIGDRVEQAKSLISAIGEIPGLRHPIERVGYRSVHYVIPFLIEKNRKEFCAKLIAQGVPVVEGYVDPLYKLNAFSRFERPCPVAEGLQAERLFYIENNSYDFTDDQINQIGSAFRRAYDECRLD